MPAARLSGAPEIVGSVPRSPMRSECLMRWPQRMPVDRTKACGARLRRYQGSRLARADDQCVRHEFSCSVVRCPLSTDVWLDRAVGGQAAIFDVRFTQDSKWIDNQRSELYRSP